MTLQIPPNYLDKYLPLNVSYPYIIRVGRSLGKSVSLQHLVETGYFLSQRSVPMKPLRRKTLTYMIGIALEPM